MVTSSPNVIEKGICFGLQIVNGNGSPVHFKKGNVVAQVEWLPNDSHIEPGEPIVNIGNLRYVESAERKNNPAKKGPKTRVIGKQ